MGRSVCGGGDGGDDDLQPLLVHGVFGLLVEGMGGREMVLEELADGRNVFLRDAVPEDELDCVVGLAGVWGMGLDGVCNRGKG